MRVFTLGLTCVIMPAHLIRDVNMNKRIGKWIKSGKVELTDSCWLWRGCLATDGYPKIVVGNNFNMKGHRYVYSVYNKDQDIDGKVVRHKCDNPVCINPDHLEIGYAKDNIKDRVERKRSFSHVSEEDLRNVSALRLSGMTYKEIGNNLGMSYKRVEYIIKRKLQM